MKLPELRDKYLCCHAEVITRDCNQGDDMDDCPEGCTYCYGARRYLIRMDEYTVTAKRQGKIYLTCHATNHKVVTMESIWQKTKPSESVFSKSESPAIKRAIKNIQDKIKRRRMYFNSLQHKTKEDVEFTRICEANHKKLIERLKERLNKIKEEACKPKKIII